MKLVDTSSWVHQIRKRGDVAVRARVEALLTAGTAICRKLTRAVEVSIHRHGRAPEIFPDLDN